MNVPSAGLSVTDNQTFGHNLDQFRSYQHRDSPRESGWPFCHRIDHRSSLLFNLPNKTNGGRVKKSKLRLSGRREREKLGGKGGVEGGGGGGNVVFTNYGSNTN